MAKLSRRENPSLPIDILTSILVQLPIKSLIRFKAVCKSWYAMITSREFSNLHLCHNALSSHRYMIFCGDDHTLYSVNLDFPVASAVRIPFPRIQERVSRKNIAGSCNGMLLCICDETPNFEALLLNPFSLLYRKVPKLGLPLNCMYVNYGLGYDCELDDYKVVRIVQFLSSFGMCREVVVYSLTSNSWKSVGQDLPGDATPTSRDGVLINDHLLHWLFWCPSLKGYQIASFDVCSEQWSEVLLPSSPLFDYVTASSDRADIGVKDGCLCLSTGDSLGWVMNRYGVRDSWTQLFMIYFGSLKRTPIVYSKKSDSILLRKDQISGVFWYDLPRKRTKRKNGHDVVGYQQVKVCIQSLVCLPGNYRSRWW